MFELRRQLLVDLRHGLLSELRARAGKIEPVRTHAEITGHFASLVDAHSSFSFGTFLPVTEGFCLKDEIKCLRKIPPPPPPTTSFQHRWQPWRAVRTIAAVRQRPRALQNARSWFASLVFFLWHFIERKKHLDAWKTRFLWKSGKGRWTAMISLRFPEF